MRAEDVFDGRGGDEAARGFVMPIDRRLVVVIACMEMGTLALAIGLMIHSRSPWWVYVLVIGSMALGVGLIGMLRLVVRYEERRLRLSFPPFYWTSIPWEDIADAEPTKADPLRDAGGWGPKSKGGATWLIAKAGPAVRLTRVSRKRPIVFSAPDAEAVALRILERAVKR